MVKVSFVLSVPTTAPIQFRQTIRALLSDGRQIVTSCTGGYIHILLDGFGRVETPSPSTCATNSLRFSARSPTWCQAGGSRRW